MGEEPGVNVTAEPKQGGAETPPTRPRAVWRAWVAAVTLVALFSGTMTPTPLFGIYRRELGLDTEMIAWVFGAYAIVIIPALPLLGHLSDRYGRRPILIAALLIIGLASIVFALADNVWWLVAGRSLQAISLALGAGAATAALMEWIPEHRRGKLKMLALVGMTFGGVVTPPMAAALAEYAPWPTVLPYVAHLAFTAVGLVALVAVGRMELPPQPKKRGWVRLRGQARLTFWVSSLAWFFCYSGMGPTVSVVPSMFSSVLHINSLVLLGVIVTANQTSVAIGGYLARPMRTVPRVATGHTIMGLSFALLAYGFAQSSLIAVGIAMIGVGFGNGFAWLGALDMGSAVAPPEARGLTISLMYMIGYSGFVAAPVMVGWVEAHFHVWVAFAGLALALLAYAATIMGLRPLLQVAPPPA